jgi:hypothetical protein
MGKFESDKIENMKTLIVTPKDEKDFEFLSSLLKRLGYSTKVLYDDEKEDLGLLKAMLEEKKEDYVPEEEIMKALGKK